jgi:DNA-binding response OmpR family regulator
MQTPSRFHVLLISLVPHAHDAVLDSFRRTGAQVSIASRPEDALVRLRRAPELVLVDLAFGAGLTPPLVAALNAGRGPSVVVALHNGTLENTCDDATHLSVDGFCRPDDLIPHARFATGAVFPAHSSVN